MTAPHTQCQPEAAAPYQHVCSDVDCCYHGQPSFRGCGCYRTREQMMLARIEELTKALREISDNCWHPSVKHIGDKARRTLSPPLEQSGSGK